MLRIHFYPPVFPCRVEFASVKSTNKREEKATAIIVKKKTKTMKSLVKISQSFFFPYAN